MKKAKWRTCKITAALLTVLMLMSMAGEIPLLSVSAEEPGGYATIAVENKPTQNVVVRQADPSTMDDYRTVLDLDSTTDGSRYAGRLWTDKSVFANGYDDKGDRKGTEYWKDGNLTLSEELDGVSGMIDASDADFLHVYSVLGSSENIQITTPVNLVIVIDNSGSMYSNSLNGDKLKALKFKDTRIYKTVDAVNRAIDSIMEAGSYNQVAVVAFGDNTSGNNSASTIIPMGSYDAIEGEDYNRYLKAGWQSTDQNQETNPDETNSASNKGGHILVNTDLVKIANGGPYSNGTTNIHAGIYQGMQELMKARTTDTVLGQKVNRVPYLVVLTDGQTTDALKIASNGSWANPQGTYDGGATQDLAKGQAAGYVNDFTNMLNSFTSGFLGTSDNKIHESWSGFVKEYSGDEKNVFDKKYTYRQYLDFSGAVNLLVDTELPNSEYNYDNTGKKKPAEDVKAQITATLPGVPDSYFGDDGDHNFCWPTAKGLGLLNGLADQYRQTQEYMILNTLLTAAYYKQAVNEKYATVENETPFNIYTISVDMTDTNQPMNANLSNTKTYSSSQDDSNMISTNGVMMNPGKCFNSEWLTKSNYVQGGEIVYPEGSMAYGVVKAIQSSLTDLETILSSGDQVTLEYVPISAGTDLKGQDDQGRDITTATKDDGGYDFDTDEFNYKVKGVGSRAQLIRQIIRGAARPVNNSYWVVSETQDYTLKPLNDNVKSAENPYGLTSVEVRANINYPTEAYYAESGDSAAQSIQDVFDQIVDQIAVPIFSPVAGTNDLGAGDSVTYMDPMGKYMEVKDVKNLVLFGRNHEITKAAVYDANFVNSITEGFQSGWYKVDKDGKWLGSGSPLGDSEHYSTESKNWVTDGESSWVYYVNQEDARKFLPTDTDNNISENTTYTFYRIAEDNNARQTLHFNPAYVTDNTKAETDLLMGKNYDVETQNHLKDPGVYALDDIRIWVEDTANNTEEHGGTMTSSGYDEALWVNIPANAVPLRIVSIEGGSGQAEEGEVKYSTNIGGKVTTAGDGNWKKAVQTQDKPLRIFYTVGIDSKVLNPNNTVNLSAISPEYINKYKIETDEQSTARGLGKGYVEFLSNWYDERKTYEYTGYSGEYKFGDPVVSFAPSQENRYYLFQDAIPLFYSKNQNVGDDVIQNGIPIDDGDNDGTLTDTEISKALSDKGYTDANLVTERSQMQDNRWYFIVVQYFVPTPETGDGKGKIQYTAIPRKGSEFNGSGEGGHTGEYLCWYDAGVNSATRGNVQDYETDGQLNDKPTYSESSNWVIAARKGGLRTDVLARTAKNKEQNVTITADTYYLPTISTASTDRNDGNDIKVDVYQGNNGRLAVIQAKTEETPGEGNLVGVGDEIKYNIHWESRPDTESVVTITDPLDNGVDFVSASYGGVEITAENADPESGNASNTGTTSGELSGIPLTISYDKGTHTVTWTIGVDGNKVPAGESGDVTLVVKVNKDAIKAWDYNDNSDNVNPGGKDLNDKDYDVKNRAQIQVNNESYYTNTVDNPTPGKTEESPGDGVIVLVGEEIDYKIHWENDRDDPSVVTVTDPLDPGVDFVSAEYRGTEIKANQDSPDQQVTDSGTVAYGPNGTEETPIEITYNPGSHTVTWTIGDEEHKVPVGMRDNVSLNVKVNEKAIQKWTYDESENSGTQGEGEDFEVLNRAQVEIDHRATYTNTVENPLESKTEETPGAGKLVGIGEEITYKIHWEAALNQDSFVEIIDPLDKGVDFVSAKYENGDKTVEITTDYYDKADTINFGGEFKSVPIHIKYDAGKHAVTWTFGSNTGNPSVDKDKKVPAGTSGEVTLVVRVNENAAQTWTYYDEWNKGTEGEGKDYEVRNRARVQVNNSSRFTNEVENPVPDKDEATPGDGKGVSIGEEITYHVHWEGDRNEESVVTVTDPLDQGVDFVSAGFDDINSNVNITADNPEAEGAVTIGETGNIPVTISYDTTSHTVTWTIGSDAEDGVKVPVGASGDVTLVVRVNENAKQTWDYEEENNSGKPGEGNDFEVYNRAHVQVNNEGGFTKKVENPLESKEEVTPGEGLPVGIGDEITYQIHWEADENLDSVIKIVDSLDEGVDFVKASFGKMVLSDGTEIEEQNYTVPKIVFYDLSRTVNWTIGSEEEDGVKVPAGASGSVTLVVKVNEKALKTWTYDETENSGAPGNGEDYEVLNRAQIDVNNNPVFTNVVENPIPEKTEEDPGDGENVGVGKEITYHVHWEGNPKEESYVTVSDPLDKGVDFVSAKFDKIISDVSITADSPSNEGIAVIDSIQGIPVSISYDSALHIVTWTIGAEGGNKVPAGATGDVTLVVKVNENAVKKWSYNESENSGEWDEGVDNEVVNRARVEVNNQGAFTNTVENPLGPEKSEVSPGDGETVGLGDVITYEITWNNYEGEAADVIITDKLDPGVDFLSASADGVTLENGELPEKPEKADLTISLVGYFKNPIEFILKLTAPEGEELSESGYVWKSDKDGSTGTWTAENNIITLNSGETVTVEGLPAGTEYSITVGEGENAKDIVKGAKLGAYGSVVKIKTAGGDATPEPDEIEASPSPVAEPTPEPEQTPETEPTPEVSSEPEENPAEDSGEGDAPETEEPTTEPSEESVEDTTPEPTAVPTEEPTSESAAESIPEEEVPQDEGQESYESEPVPDAAEEESQTDSDENFAARAVAYFGKLFRTVRARGTLSTVNPVMAADETEVIEEDPQMDSETEITESEPAADETIPTPEDTETAEATPESETYEENSQVDAEENSEAEDPEAVLPEESAEPETMSTPEPTSAPEDEPASDPSDELTEEPEGEPSAEPSDDPETDAEAEPSADPEEESEADPETVPEEESEAEPETDVEAEPEEEPEDSPETDEATEGEGTDYDLIAEVTDNPVPVAQNSGDSETGNETGSPAESKFDPDTKTLGGEEPALSTSLSGDIHIYYFAKAHTVVWVLEQRPSGSSGEVYLSVQVNKDADKLWNYDNPELPPSDSETDHLVHNKAGVKVGHNPEQETNTVHNPTEPNKTETSINGSDVSQDLVLDESDGTLEAPQVNVGDTITYRIEWMNDATNERGEFVPSRIVVIDTLDPDVDFVSANNGGKYYENGGTLPAKDGYDEIQIPAHSVVWDLGERQAREKGTVELTVRVRESALQKGEVVNSATVMVGNTPKQTNKVKNPVEEDGTLTVRKTVTGIGDRNKDWHFRVELGDKSINGTYGEMTFTDGVAEFTLKHGESKTATGLPVGTTYAVTEEEANQGGYFTSSTGETGTITGDGSAHADFVNSTGLPPDFPPAYPPTTTPPTTFIPTPTPETTPTPVPPMTSPPTPTEPPAPPEPPTDTPPTGDGRDIVPWLAACGISALGIVITSRLVKKSRRGKATRR